jgi:hypothetical protein
VSTPSVPAVRAPSARTGEPASEAAAGGSGIPELISTGIAAARANPALVAVRWVGDMVVAALVVAGTLLPPVALFGSSFAGRFAPLAEAFGERDADALAVAVLDLADAVAAAPGAVAVGLAGLLAMWTLAMFVYCWLQGGFYGVLVAADRGAAFGAGAQAVRAAVFPAARRSLGSGARALPVATFSAARFAAAARRLLWPYFWFVNLYATALLLVALVALLPLALVPAPPSGDPPLASLAAAAAVLPLAALAAAVLAVWYALGRVEVARGAGVSGASRRALAALRRRPGPVLAVTLLAAGAALTVSGVTVPVGAALAMLPGAAALAAGGVLAAVQWLASAAVATAYGGALVRLMRLEFPGAPAREATT